MSNLINIQNGQAVTTSRQVGLDFCREHKNVLADIREILAAENQAAKFFFESTYENRGKQYPEFIMNRDGFTLLAMGFTGSDALQWKIKYIQAFNEMEKQIANPTISSKISELEVKNKNAEARLKNAQTRQANFLLENLKKYKHILCLESVELLTANAFEMIAGKNFLPRPMVEPKYYTATQIGKMVNKSSSAIGKIANSNNLKTPEYGHMVLDKSKYSSKQVETFRYNEAGKNKILNLLKQSEAV